MEQRDETLFIDYCCVLWISAGIQVFMISCNEIQPSDSQILSFCVF